MNENNDIAYMALALEQARLAARAGEVPVGAVLVDRHGEVLAASHNQPISAVDPTAHAEIRVLREAARNIDNYRLIDTTLYVTLEPCVMCVGAMIHARIGRLVYGAAEYKTGAIQSAARLLDDVRFNHVIEVQSGILEQPCREILSEFFARRRQAIKQSKGDL
jgi:tRNA(adenine34) deaminase